MTYLNKCLFQKDIQMANKPVKIYSSVIREMQIRPIVRHHFTPTKMAIIKKTTTSDTRMWKNQNPHCWWEVKMMQLL
jgi:hypothetical protein